MYICCPVHRILSKAANTKKVQSSCEFLRFQGIYWLDLLSNLTLRVSSVYVSSLGFATSICSLGVPII